MAGSQNQSRAPEAMQGSLIPINAKPVPSSYNESIVTKTLSWPHCSKCKRPLSLVPAKSGGRVIRCDFCDSHDPSDSRDSNASRKDID